MRSHTALVRGLSYGQSRSNSGMALTCYLTSSPRHEAGERILPCGSNDGEGREDNRIQNHRLPLRGAIADRSSPPSYSGFLCPHCPSISYHATCLIFVNLPSYVQVSFLGVLPLFPFSVACS
ncbi:hypothetical protein GQ55_2G045100 [Panicum hallii var. hallii]|uniref:Uncharacterized protein n=1 Tax=Panicum hallii var. hallii TaxID=1504633 RepID=A0A2T7ELE3_9POAL|nr:hypothetical protein GQ55_2G045100 [Panicum hallii var. hallii]